VYAHLREWTDPVRMLRAWARDPAMGVGDDARPEDAGLPNEPYELESRCWLADGGRAREEGPGGLIVVQDGDHWWRSHPALGVQTNNGDPNSVITVCETLRGWADPAAALALLGAEEAGEATVAGRPARRLRAAGVAGRPFELAWLGWAADGYELLVDAEHGTVLATRALLEGEPFMTGEALAVSFEPPDPGLFAALGNGPG
jgi:hypothetical protein